MEKDTNPLVYQEYISRVNAVQDYINSNLHQDLSLSELAGVAGFSEYHFHRIFSSVVRETLYKYINRLRLEKAANLLTGHKIQTITEVALDCGFSDSAVFARSFKKQHGVSASEYRNLFSKNRQADRKNCKDQGATTGYPLFQQDNRYAAGTIRYKVDVGKMEELTVVYLRYTGPYKNNPAIYRRLISKLLKWAEARELLNQKEMKLFTIYHDNPEITEARRQRTTICLAVPKGTPVDGVVGTMTIAAGKYAIGQFEIIGSQFETAWNSLFGKWLPSSGYQADDRPCFELYRNNPDDHPQKKTLVDIYLPIKPL